MKRISIPIIAISLLFSFASKGQSLSPSQMDTLLHHHFADSSLVIIDVCTDAVYNAGHLQNAIHRDLYLSSLTADMDTMDKSKLYVLHCISGFRSASAMNTMKGKGFTRVYDISGGFSNWKTSGFPYQTDTIHSSIRFYSEIGFQTKLSKCSNPVIIDFRADSLFEKKHLIDAQNIDTTKTQLSSLMVDTTKSYFIYGNNMQSVDSLLLYSKYLAKYRSVTFLKSGFDSWELAGYPIYEKVDTSAVVSPLVANEQIATIKQSQNTVTIIPTQNTVVCYSFYTIDGSSFSKGTIVNETTLSTEQFVKGIYILRISSKFGNFSQKILK
jgi:phage shock protein E